ncbi:MAG: hypothetical protein WCK51_10005 [Armatimonadota bacterium]
MFAAAFIGHCMVDHSSPKSSLLDLQAEQTLSTALVTELIYQSRTVLDESLDKTPSRGSGVVWQIRLNKLQSTRFDSIYSVLKSHKKPSFNDVVRAYCAKGNPQISQIQTDVLSYIALELYYSFVIADTRKSSSASLVFQNLWFYAHGTHEQASPWTYKGETKRTWNSIKSYVVQNPSFLITISDFLIPSTRDCCQYYAK